MYLLQYFRQSQILNQHQLIFVIISQNVVSMVLAQAFHSLPKHTSMSRSKSKLSFAFVHHANQFLITDGYANKSGIFEVAGRQGSKTGLFNLLEIHRKYRVPLNIHISGTLLESLAWH